MKEKNADKNSREFWIISNLLEKMDIQVGGNRAWDIQIHSPDFARRVMTMGGLGLGDSYIEGDWDANSVDSFINHILRARLDKEIKSFGMSISSLKSRFHSLAKGQKPWKFQDVLRNLPNEFFEAILGTNMSFTSGYWAAGAKTLEEAQQARRDMTCKKLNLKQGMRLLDAGSGWGGFSAFAAEHYGVECVCISSFKGQHEWASQHYAHLPIEFVQNESLMLDGMFDCIVSIDRFEHLPQKNYRVYLEMGDRILEEDGLLLLQSTGKNERRLNGKHWFDTHILQNNSLPTIAQIAGATNGLFVMEDMHNFGSDYDKTLMAWYQNFEAAWPALQKQYKFDEKLYRTWKYYLLSSAGAYRANDLQQWQCIFSKQHARNPPTVA